MSMFSTLMGKIFSHPAAAAAPAPAASQPAGGSPGIAAKADGSTNVPVAATTADPAQAPATASAPASAPAQSVDVAAVLNDLDSKSSEQLDWQHSIVDMMKLLGMDSSLSARKHLATELNYTGDEGDSASMNVWLHKEVMQKLAENGGKVPAGLS